MKQKDFYRNQPFEDYLKERVHHTEDEQQVQEMSKVYRFVPKTSSFATRVFGRLDFLLRNKPKSQLFQLRHISCSQTITHSWLESKETHDLEAILKTASKNARKLHKTF